MAARLILLLLALAAAVPVAAQPLVVSPGPESVSVTVYRDPERGEEAMDTDWLQGFALISETRTIRLPAGASEIRFEGVAGGILPVSAIVSGLPGGVDEKNRDARLLSPGTLIDAALGRRVHIRRTNRVTGAVTESEAVIRSGPDGVVLQTSAGIEALRCTGLPETLVFDSVPEGLSDRPTLAVRTTTAAAATATVTLSYLASDFDWDANYIAQIAPDGRTLELFAWLTLANENDESFLDARTQVVAGTLNREEEDEGDDPEPVSSGIQLRCWPQGTTSDAAFRAMVQQGTIDGYADDGGGDIIVTGSRVAERKLLATPATAISAEQEELGDLKLYRIPEPVTVAAHAQKQVALLRRTAVPFERLYEARVGWNQVRDPAPAAILLRMKNVAARGLGLPLPSGGVAIFEEAEGRQMLAGETRIEDKAIGQDVELAVGESAEVQVRVRMLDEKSKPDEDAYEGRQWTKRRYEIEVTNANPHPVQVETLIIMSGPHELAKPSRKLGVKDGRRMWAARVPANGRSTLTYTLVYKRNVRVDDEDDEEYED